MAKGDKHSVVNCATEGMVMDPSLADEWEGIPLQVWISAQYDYGRGAGSSDGYCSAARTIEDLAVEYFKSGQDTKAQEYRELATNLRAKADEKKTEIYNDVRKVLEHHSTIFASKQPK